MPVLRIGPLQRRPAGDAERMPQMQPPHAHRRTGPYRCPAGCRRPCRNRRPDAPHGPAEVQGFPQIPGARVRSGQADGRNGSHGGDERDGAVRADGAGLLRIRLHGRFDGLGGGRTLCPGRPGSHQPAAAFRLCVFFGGRAHAGIAVLADADGQDHGHAASAVRSRPAVHQHPD